MFKSLLCWLLMSFVVLPCLAQGGGLSDEVSDRDRRAVRAVVEAQLKALAADNAERAFSFATPEIRKQFQDAATFLDMVRRSYPMVIRPVSTSFLRPRAGGG